MDSGHGLYELLYTGYVSDDELVGSCQLECFVKPNPKLIKECFLLTVAYTFPNSSELGGELKYHLFKCNGGFFFRRSFEELHIGVSLGFYLGNQVFVRMQLCKLEHFLDHLLRDLWILYIDLVEDWSNHHMLKFLKHDSL